MVKTKAGDIVTDGKTRSYRHHPKAPSPPNSPLIIFPELEQYGIRFTRKHILDLMRKGKFPAARQIGTNRVAWVRAEIAAYISTRPIARAAQPESGDAA
jgi:predicted DNA-binding transcriptional regulator AlpA